MYFNYNFERYQRSTLKGQLMSFEPQSNFVVEISKFKIQLNKSNSD